MIGLKSAFARVHNVNAEPEQVFAAAMIVAAAEAAREGDCAAFQWLESSCSLRWLVAVTPPNDDCERVRAALLATIPEPACPGSTLAIRAGPSETVGYCVQLELPGLRP